MSSQDFTEDIIYPSILFRLRYDFYAVNCRNVASIMQIPDIEPLPKAPQNVLGIFRFREKVIPVICLRSLFGMPTVEREIQDFSDMMDARKQDHITWVQEFDRCANSGMLFTLASDCHKCALGRWYDQYKPDSSTMKMQLQKMEEPHKRLHEAVGDLDQCKKLYKGEKFDQARKKILDKLEKEYMPEVVSVLENAKGIYKEDRRTLLIVIDTGKDSFAVAVDEVLSVEDLQDVAPEEQVEKLKGSSYITEIKKSPKLNRLILMINDEKLTEITEKYQLEK